MKRADRGGLTVWFKLIIAGCLIAFAISSLAVLVSATTQAYFAVICGITLLGIEIIIRHFGLGPWGLSAIVSVIATVAITVASLNPALRSEGLALAFASHASPPLITVTYRILTEASWFGTGAGTFAAILPIYRDIDELKSGLIAPTAAAAIAVEMGRPFLWALLTAATALVVALLRSALRRGRDSFYPTAGASCIVTAIILAFSNTALFSTPALIIVAVTVGVAVAQSKSRSI
jgi:hypothetical protein